LLLDETSALSEYRVDEGLLEHNSDYFWRVNALKVTRKSEWSEIFSFSTEDDIVTVTSLLLPENESVEVSVQPKMQWESLTDATDYFLQVSSSASFSDYAIDVSIPTVEYNVPKGRLDYNTQYFWRVKARIHNHDREWSSINSFTTEVLVLNPPVLTSPEDNEIEVTVPVALDWEDVADVDEYAIQVSKTDTFEELLVEENVTASDFEIPAEITEYETDYFWRIKAIISSYESDWSITRKFTTGEYVSVKEKIITNGLLRISPNPVKNSATINYKISYPSDVQISIFNNSGIEIEKLVNSYKNDGEYSLVINTGEFPIGVYFMKMTLANNDLTVKFNVVR